MAAWLKENAILVIITLCVTGVLGFWIHNSYRLAQVNAEVKKIQAEEGRKFKFGVTSDRK